MYLARTPAWLKVLHAGRTWSVATTDKVLYLTFDDGPIPEVTPWVLDLLSAHKAKATFFVLGKNADAHGELFQRIGHEGHSVGNHTWDHLNGWRTPLPLYVENVERAQAITGTHLFRPPYGRMTRAQHAALRARFEVVMWDVLSGDFDTDTDEEKCLRNVVRNARPGSIIVFHDSLKAETRLRYALPRALAYFTTVGYRFEALPPAGIKVPRK